MMQRKRQKIINRNFCLYAFQAILAIQGYTCEADTILTEMDLGNSVFYQNIL